MLLFVGLGNPGTRYARNRHNIGFVVVEEIARRHGFAPWRRRFQGEASEGTLGSERVILLKPTTYMNDSGRAVQEAANFFKLAAGDITVFQDELECSVDNIPQFVDADVSGLEIGYSLHLSDIKLPAGVKSLMREDATLVTIVPPSGYAEEQKAAAAAAAAAAAGAVAAPGAAAPAAGAAAPAAPGAAPAAAAVAAAPAAGAAAPAAGAKAPAGGGEKKK